MSLVPMDDIIYLVPEDKSEEVRPLEEKELGERAERTKAISTILDIASILVHYWNLNPSIANLVLEYMGINAFTMKAETHEIVRSVNNANQIYLELPTPSMAALDLPKGVSSGPCKAIIVETTSKDQGWASQDNHFSGTYRDSWTWFDLRVARFEAEAGDERLVAEDQVTSNLRCHRDYRHHRKEYTDPDGLIQSVLPGDILRLVIRSKFGAWTNNVKYGLLEVSFPIFFNEDFADQSNIRSIPTRKSSNKSNRECCMQ